MSMLFTFSGNIIRNTDKCDTAGKSNTGTTDNEDNADDTNNAGLKKGTCIVYTDEKTFGYRFSKALYSENRNANLRTGGERELYDFLNKNQSETGLVLFTGGEPLKNDGLLDVMRHIKGYFGTEIGLDTFGTEPDRLFEVVCEGIAEYVTMDIPECRSRYEMTADVDMCGELWEKLEESRTMLIEEDEIVRRFRTVAVGGLHTAGDFREIGEFINGAETLLIKRFHGISDKEIQSFAEAARPYVKNIIPAY